MYVCLCSDWSLREKNLPAWTASFRQFCNQYDTSYRFRRRSSGSESYLCRWTCDVAQKRRLRFRSRIWRRWGEYNDKRSSSSVFIIHTYCICVLIVYVYTLCNVCQRWEKYSFMWMLTAYSFLNLLIGSKHDFREKSVFCYTERFVSNFSRQLELYTLFRKNRCERFG